MSLGLMRFASCVRNCSRLLSSSHLKPHYDVVVVGGGMVGFGFTAFAGLHPMLRNKRILLVDDKPKKEFVRTSNHSIRVVTITPKSRSLLENVGAWSEIEATRYQPIYRMKIFENGTTASLLLDRPNSKDPLGYIMENDLIVSSLMKSVEKFAAESGTDVRPGSIEVVYNSSVENILIPKEFSETDLPKLSINERCSDEKATIEASLIVGADGFNSAVRRASAIHTIGWEHDQSAIIGNLVLNSGYDCFTAWQRFTETGPIALLPLGPETCSFTWSTTRSEAKRLMALCDEDFVNELDHSLSRPSYRPRGLVSTLSRAIRAAVSNKRTSFEPPKIVSIKPGTRAQIPLSFSHCTFYHGPRVALIGDAAHRLLPLSGQGVNMGFGDAACLAETINRALYHGEDIANPRHLADFTSERQRSVFPMSVFVEGIQALYAPDEVFGGPLTMHGPPASKRALLRRLSSRFGVSDAVLSLRGLGLDLVDACPPLKRFFVEASVTGRIQLPSFRSV